MAQATQSEKVLIIGAGLGGLVLAQILNKNKVPFELFERDERLDSRKQGWAVALVESLPGMRELLPTQLAQDLPSNSVNINTGDHDEIGFVDAGTGEKVGSVGGKPLYEPGSILRTSREGFRAFLWRGGDLSVSTGKNFTHYTTDSQGVTAYFSDGSTATGSLLLGADGAHSKILDELITKAKHRPSLSKLVPVFAEYDIPPKIYEPLRERGKSVLLATVGGVYIQIGMMSMKEDKSSAHFFWTIMPHRDSPNELSDWVQHASKQELYDFCIECTKDMHPFVKDLVEFGGKDAIVQQSRFLEFEPPDELPSGRVSVLGDAAHTMIPFRGAGANTAIVDACDLGRLLVEANKAGKDLAGVLPQYHEVMIPRGQENVRSSHAAGEMNVQKWVEIFRKRAGSQ